MRLSLLLLALLVVLAVLSLAEAKKKKTPGPCRVKNCKKCNLTGKKCKVCNAGYKPKKRGKKCGAKACAVNPCLNGGVCKEKKKNVESCVCSGGYSGNICENAPTAISEPDPCRPNPCKNGGSCKWGVCTCAAGFSGGECQTADPVGIATAITCSATCDNVMNFYVGSQLLASSGNWQQTSTVTVAAGATEISIQCLDQGSAAGIIASCTGVVTDGSWKCAPTGSQSYAAATVAGNNGMGPWRSRPGIAANAQWIWYGHYNNPGVKDVTCKKDLTEKTCSATCDNVMNFYADGTLLASSGDWTKTTTVALPKGTKEVSIQCLDQGSAAGIIASCGNVVTNAGWKCAPTGSQSYASATVAGNNGMGPWRSRPGIAGHAQWIWYGHYNNPGVKDVTCKITL